MLAAVPAVLSLEAAEIALEEKLEHYFGSPDADPRLRIARRWMDGLIDEFRQKEVAGATLPWTKTHHNIRLRAGEVSLWPGINGHGKSLLTSQVALDLVAQNHRTVVASLEMWPVKTLARMARQAIGNNNPTDQALRDFVDWLARRFWIYDQHGRANPRHMLAVMRYAAIEFKVEHFFLDSLMMVCKGEDDYNGQKDFITELCAVAKDTGLHVHLIHHTRKLAKESDIPGKFDSKGSGSITDQVDNVFTIWRNKEKEGKRQRGEDFDEMKPDALLVCDKQRHGEWEGMVGLYFDPASLSYRGELHQGWARGYEFTKTQQQEPGSDG